MAIPLILSLSKDVAIPMRMNTRRRTAVATTTRVPRYAYNHNGMQNSPMGEWLTAAVPLVSTTVVSAQTSNQGRLVTPGVAPASGLLRRCPHYYCTLLLHVALITWHVQIEGGGREACYNLGSI